MKEMSKDGAAVDSVEELLHLGELEHLDDAQWARVEQEFFRR